MRTIMAMMRERRSARGMSAASSRRDFPMKPKARRSQRQLQRHIAVMLLGFFYFVAMANAQLGPIDGTTLPATDLERVKIGDTAPDFTLENMDGRRITLSEVYRTKNVILVFYRGQW